MNLYRIRVFFGLGLLGLILFSPFSTTANQTNPVPSVDEISRAVRQWGRVTEAHFFPSTSSSLHPLIIHIQTAHGQYEVQKKIESLLRYFSQALNVNLLLAEGAGVKLEPAVDRYFFNNAWQREVMERRTKKGLASGVSLFLSEASQNPFLSSVQAYGIESIGAYRSNRETYISLIEGFPAAKNDLVSFERTLDRWMSRELNSKLYQFLKSEKEYREGERDPAVYLHSLILAAKDELKHYPALKALARLQEQERTPEPEHLLHEIDRLSRSLAGRLASTKKEKQAARLFFRFERLKQFLLLQIDRDAFERIRSKPVVYEPLHLYHQLMRLGLDKDKTTLERVHALRSRFYEGLKFYRGAIAREKGMVENSIDRIMVQKTKAALLVTGGFHSKGLKEKFLEKGFSYVLITPSSEAALSLHERMDFGSFLKKLPHAVPFAAIEDGVVLPVSSRLEEHGFAPAYFRDLRLWAIADFISGAGQRLEVRLRREFNQSPFARNTAVAITTVNHTPVFRLLSSLKRSEMRGDFFSAARLSVLRRLTWFREKETLREEAADTIAELGYPVPAWTSQVPAMMEWLRPHFTANRKAGRRTAIFFTGLQGTAKSSITKTVATIISNDKVLKKGGLKGVRTIMGDRSRLETPPDDFEVDGRTIGEFRDHLRQQYPKYLEINQSYEAAVLHSERERLGSLRRDYLEELNRFNADLDQLGLRPLNISGEYAEDIYRQNDTKEQIHFWRGVKGKLDPNQITDLDQHLTFFDLNSRGKLRLRLSEAGNIQIIFRLKSKVHLPRGKTVDGHLLAELTQNEIPENAWFMEIEPLPSDNKNKTWKLAFKEENQWLTEEEVQSKTEFFEMNPVIRRIEQPRARGQKSKGFSITIFGSRHEILIPHHRRFFELHYEGSTGAAQIHKGQFKDMLIRYPAEADEIFLFDWSVPVALDQFDAIFILTADPTVRLARQVDRYDPRKATISLDNFVDHLLESFYKIDPWIIHELEKIQELAQSAGHPKIWVGSTTNREDVIISHAQTRRLTNPLIESTLQKRFFVFPTDFPEEEKRFRVEGWPALLQKRLNQVPPEVAIEQAKKWPAPEEWMTTPGGITVFRSGEFLYKGRFVRGHFGLTAQDIALLEEIRRRARDNFVPFDIVDFKNEPYRVLLRTEADRETWQPQTVTFGTVFVHTKGVSLEDYLHYLTKTADEARLNAQIPTMERYETEIKRVQAAAETNDDNLTKVGLINTTPERAGPQKILAPDGSVLHSSFSTLQLQAPHFYEQFFKMGRARVLSSPPVSSMWTPEIDRRQRRILLPVIVRSKIREINHALRQNTQEAGQEDVQGVGEVLRWIDFFIDRIAYRNTVTGRILDEVFNTLQQEQNLFNFDHYWVTAFDAFLNEFPQLKNPESTDRIFLGHFRDFIPRHFTARTIILDYDGVITQYHNNHGIFELFKQTFGGGMTDHEFKSLFDKIFSKNKQVRAVRDAAMTGEETFEAYISLLNQWFQKATQLTAEVSIGDYLNHHRGAEILDPGIVPLVNKWLAQGIRVLVLTDQYAGTGAENRVRKAIIKYLPGIHQEDIYFSFSPDIRARKKQGEKAFRPILEVLGAEKNPGETLLVDNSQRNTEAAAKLGLQVFRYDSSRQGRLDDALIVTRSESRGELRASLFDWVKSLSQDALFGDLARRTLRDLQGRKGVSFWMQHFLSRSRGKTGYLVGPQIFKRLGPVLPALQKINSTKIRFAVVASGDDLSQISEAVQNFNRSLKPRERLVVYANPHLALKGLTQDRYYEIRGLGLPGDAGLLRGVLPEFIPWSEAELDLWVGKVPGITQVLETFKEAFERLSVSA